MVKVELRNEILFKAPTHIGLLADVADSLHTADVNILAIGAYDKGDVGEFLLLTSNNKAAFAALESLGGEVDLAPVVVAEVENEPGELAIIARRLSNAGININQIHATSTDSATVMLILRTDRELEVVELLEGV